jgi:hypothetical protein
MTNRSVLQLHAINITTWQRVANSFFRCRIKDRRGEIIVAEELLIAFEGAAGESDAGFEVQGVLDVGSEDVGFDGLCSLSVEEVGEEDEAGHGIEFFSPV